MHAFFSKKESLLLALAALLTLSAAAQETVSIDIKARKPAGRIDPMLYGQLFEHIYYSANNGVWQELIEGRSFEPEHFPGIPPRDGYFDGWYMDDEEVLHSPTRYEQPLRLVSVDTDDYEISMEVNWRSYRLARRAWSGGLMDIRFAVKNQADGEPYFVRLHNPYYEVRTFTPAQTEAQVQAAALARARQQASAQPTEPNFSIATMVEKEVPAFWGGGTRKVKTLDPLFSKVATAAQINENQDWHKLRIVCKSKGIKVFWDGKQVLSGSKLDAAGHNDIVLWVNYTEATYRNIRVTGGKTVFFEGTPADVMIPAVAPRWKAFGNGTFSLVKGDAVNMDYSQRITARGVMETGISQGPLRVVEDEAFVGSLYAKGDGHLSVGLKRGDQVFYALSMNPPGPEWKKLEFEIPARLTGGDAEFAILVSDGTVQVDQVTLSTATGQALGGFRPDIFRAVKELHPTCLRWPGGGYVAQYHWQWGIGPQEKRQRWPHWMWMDYDQNCFGTDEFIRFCREVGTEPVIVVPVGFDRPESEAPQFLEDALAWLRYCNEPATGEWGAKRAENGHPEPYNVKYWEIDNEMWEMGIDKYEERVRTFSEAMRAIDPSIKIIACGGFQEDEAFLMRSAGCFDYLSLHHYEQRDGYASGPKKLGEMYDRYARMIAACPNPNVKLFISEWNLNSIDWRTGLFAGGFLNECEKRDVVAMGAAALFIRRTDAPDWNNAFINFDYKDLFVAPNYQVTELWYDHFSPYLLDFSGETGDLNIVSTLSENGREVIVKVVNPTEKAARLTVTGDWKGVASAAYEYYAPGSLDVANSMAQKDAVALKKAGPSVAAGQVVLEVEPLSAGVLTIVKEF